MKLKKRNPRVFEAVAAVMEAAADYRRGDLIRYEAIEAAIGGRRYEGIWPQVVAKLKRQFERDRGITLICCPGTAYKLATHDEQMTVCVESRSKRARRQLVRGVGHLNALPVAELSGHQQRVRSGKLDIHKRAVNDVSRARRQDKAILQVRETNFSQRKR